MSWFVNYRLNSSVSVSDRGLTYGDGVFETILATPNTYIQFDDHISRLLRGLVQLGMPLSVEDKATLIQFLHTQILPLVNNRAVVKVIVTRGEGGRGYLPPENCKHTIIIGVLPAPNYDIQQEKGVSLSVSPVPISNNHFLAGIKHLNRLENIMAKRFLGHSDFEAIMLNTNDELVECIQSNIFWFKDGILYTPSLELSGVKGTFRQNIIENQTHYSIQIGAFQLPTLLSSDEVFITNSLMSIVPVISVSGKSFPIGAHTRKLQNLLQVKDENGVH